MAVGEKNKKQLVILINQTLIWAPAALKAANVWKFSAHLTVEAKQQQHNEEENCPKCRKRHHGYSLGVGDESQAWTCRGGGSGTRTEGDVEASLVSCRPHLICIPGRKRPQTLETQNQMWMHHLIWAKILEMDVHEYLSVCVCVCASELNI